MPINIHITPGPRFAERFVEIQKEGRGLAMTFNPGAYLRLIAKIAHAHAVAEIGLDAAHFLLRDIILGKNNDYPNYIGPLNIGKENPWRTLHTLSHWWLGEYLITRVRLYAIIGTPSQFVVTARR